MNFEMRIEKLRNSLKDNDLDGFVVVNIRGSDVANLSYLTGFNSQGALIITYDCKILITTSTEVELTKAKIRGVKIAEFKFDLIEKIVNTLKDMSLRRIGINSKGITFHDYRRVEKELKPIELIPLENRIERLRLYKDGDEIKRIEKAVEITDKAFSHALEVIRPGMTERDLAIELECFMRSAGAEGLAFPPIIAVGENSAFPHAFPDAMPEHRNIKEGSLLLIDMGARYEGYCSDMTRTIVVGNASDKQKEIYKIVLEAQRKAIGHIKDGIRARDIDQAAREVIEKAGYGEKFMHGLGHGVGLEISEKPMISQEGENEIRTGMVFTIEPGIYIPNWGGIRIEDTVLLEESDCRVLTTSPKERLCQI